MSSENAHGYAESAENGFGFDFLQLYHKNCYEIFSQIVRVTGDETCVSFVNVENKEQSKQWVHTLSPNKLSAYSTRELLEDFN
jgi:hypothetical protein